MGCCSFWVCFVYVCGVLLGCFGFGYVCLVSFTSLWLLYLLILLAGVLPFRKGVYGHGLNVLCGLIIVVAC